MEEIAAVVLSLGQIECDMSWGYVFRAYISVQSVLNSQLYETNGKQDCICMQIPGELLLEYLRSTCLMICSQIALK